MNRIYSAIGTTKQNMHQRLNQQLMQNEEMAQITIIIRQIRENHPRMGAKELYRKIRPSTMGRDSFRIFYNGSGFKILNRKNYKRTTNSQGVTRFPNLIRELELTYVNQVWVSDITYYEIGSRFYYLTFIMDLYSSKIIGYNASKTLRTVDTTIPALHMALNRLNGTNPKPILHSDGGGQYYCKEFLALTNKKTDNSMGESVYENPHAERVNGTIKNSYLKGYAPDSFVQLTRMLTKAVNMYNNEKPHKAIGGLSPVEFELLEPVYQQKIKLLTKKKVTKKENINNSSNKFVKLLSKTVNPI